MSRFIEHTHEPVYRVVRANWADPLDAGFSRRGEGGRWNTPEFPALYCCCSPVVARAVAMDVFRMAGVELSDLVPDARPQLVEIGWSGGVADMASAKGIDTAGFPAGYPEGASSGQTRRAAAEWRAMGAEGVVARSASLARMGMREWAGEHWRWSELTIFADTTRLRPALGRRHAELDWLSVRGRMEMKPPYD
ncbi:MAG: RES family NAD+ phosphorylase [Bryobacterales bacterium]|nr:RES family NAD+ phosphorylase [Bryobacterales bacterium]